MRHARRRGRIVRWGARLLAVGVALGAALLAAEWLLPEPALLQGAIWRQARGSIEEHAPGRLRPKAHFTGVQTVGGGRQHVRHNALGMRGPEVGPRQPGEVRVLFVGDSITYGTGVQEDETFALRLAGPLGAALGRRVTTGISACPGFGVRDHADLLARVQDAFAPDLVVACVFVENDLYDDLQLERGVFAGYPVFQAPQVRLLRASWRARLAVRSNVAFALERLLAAHWPALAMDLSGAALRPEEAALWEGVAPDQSVLFLEQVDAPPALHRMLDRTRAALADLRARAGDAALAVVLVPSYVQYLPGLFDHLAAQRSHEGEHRCGTIQARLLALCAELGLPAFDLLPPLRAAPDPAALLIANDFHFTPRGHETVAALLAPWLAELLRR